MDEALAEGSPATLGNLGDQVGNGVGKGLEDDNATNPTVDQVEGVERDARDLDEGVVAASQQEEREHVHDAQHTGTVAELTGSTLAAEVDVDDGEGDVHARVQDQVDGLQTAGEGANVDGRGQLVLTVVTLAEQGRVKQVGLEPSVPPVGGGEVALVGVVQAGNSSDVAHEGDADKVDHESSGAGQPGPAEPVGNVDVLVDGLHFGGQLGRAH